MASSFDLGSAWSSSNSETFCGYFNINIDDDDYPLEIVEVLEAPSQSLYHSGCLPAPPPPPPPPPPLPHPHKISRRSLYGKVPCYSSVPKETQHVWDIVFQEGHGADVCIVTDENLYIMAHSSILSVASPVLASFIQQLKVLNGITYARIPGVPHDAAHTFIRFLYSSCYEEEAMKKFVLHMLVLSHAYSVPSLKRICIFYLENCWLTKENVVDVLQLARKCDAPRLSLFCTRMVMKDFKTISLTEAWRVMRCSDPDLEQELLESIVEADSWKQKRLKKMEERKVFLQLYEAMEALIHICRDGCGTIGPRDKMLKGSQVVCGFPACKGLETLVRHFSSCKIRVPGGCVPCKRMWQLFELHSRMCGEPDTCKVPLCRHLKEKMRQHSKKDEAKWKLLVSKVIAAKNTLGPFSARKSVFI